jgi:hypothetical protein
MKVTRTYIVVSQFTEILIASLRTLIVKDLTFCDNSALPNCTEVTTSTLTKSTSQRTQTRPRSRPEAILELSYLEMVDETLQSRKIFQHSGD